MVAKNSGGTICPSCANPTLSRSKNSTTLSLRR
jgi:hypothetical protein